MSNINVVKFPMIRKSNKKFVHLISSYLFILFDCLLYFILFFELFLITDNVDLFIYLRFILSHIHPSNYSNMLFIKLGLLIVILFK